MVADTDRESEQGQENALAFCNLFLQLLRLIKLYDVDNVTFNDPIAQIRAQTAEIVARFGAVRVQSEEGMIYFNKEPMRGGRRSFTTIQGLVKAMDGLGIAEMVFAGAVADQDVRTLCRLIREFGEAETEAVRGVQAGLDEAGIKDRISVFAAGETSGKAIVRTIEIDERTFFPLAYARTLVLLREYVKNLSQEELNRYFTQKLHRAVQEIVNLAPRYFNRFLALAAIRETDEYVFTHMASTGILSVLLGQKLGIGKVKLSDLGLAAMLHGLGRFRSGPALIERDQLAPEEKMELGKHPYRTLGAILEGRKVTGKMLVTATTGFQFDLHTGRTPLRIPPTEVHPFCQVIRVCEAYTRLTSELTDRPALLPDQAIKAMVEAKPGSYDPLILTVFVNMMGLYPTGTVVTLSTGEVAVVVHPNPERPKQPLVAVVRSPSGDDVDGDMLDLADPDVPSRITGSVDPAELGLHIPEYLLS